MAPQDFYNMFLLSGAGNQPATATQNNAQVTPLSFLGRQPQQGAAPQQGQAMGALGQQGGNAYGQIGGLIGGGIKSLLANYGANGASNTLADAVGFQPFGGGGWGSGA